MKFQKNIAGELEKCYSASSFYIKEKQKILFASEVQAQGIVLDPGAEHMPERFPTPGGVMAMTAWPGLSNGFASIYGFYPPFMAENSGLLLTVMQETGTYVSKNLLKLPYLHRFETIQSENRTWLLLSVLCRKKQSRDDWSSPGYVAVLPIEDDGSIKTGPPIILLDGQYRNHGMWKGIIDGKSSIITTSDQGIYAFSPADRETDWKVELFLEKACGEAVIYDMDGDGEEELITISPFHGFDLSIYKKSGKRWNKIWSFPEKLEFAHSLWAGMFCEKRVIFCGHRRGKGDLLAIWTKDGQWQSTIVDSNVGSSNICVSTVGKEQYLLSANHGQGQYAGYQLIKDG